MNAMGATLRWKMCIRDSYEAALSRSKADWIVGINGTRLFTTLYHKKLVVGRVQTPTLAMLVERDGKILSLIHISENQRTGGIAA